MEDMLSIVTRSRNCVRSPLLRLLLLQLAKASEAQAAKDAKRMDSFINRKTNGKFGECATGNRAQWNSTAPREWACVLMCHVFESWAMVPACLAHVCHHPCLRIIRPHIAYYGRVIDCCLCMQSTWA
jgi:hypothetical protein